jgi:hypothetical protein
MSAIDAVCVLRECHGGGHHDLLEDLLEICAVHESASLIGRLGSSAFRLSTTAASASRHARGPIGYACDSFGLMAVVYEEPPARLHRSNRSNGRPSIGSHWSESA